MTLQVPFQIVTRLMAERARLKKSKRGEAGRNNSIKKIAKAAEKVVPSSKARKTTSMAKNPRKPRCIMNRKVKEMRGSNFKKTKAKLAKLPKAKPFKAKIKILKVGDSSSSSSSEETPITVPKVKIAKPVFPLGASTAPSTSLFGTGSSWSSLGNPFSKPFVAPKPAPPAPPLSTSAAAPDFGPQPNYDLSKVEAGHHFSRNMYYNVKRIYDSNGKTYGDLSSCDGRTAQIESRILPQICFSADHFEKTVQVSMTQMPILLEKAKDSIFKVSYFRKPDEDKLENNLQQFAAKDIKNLEGKEFTALKKALVQGELVTVIGHHESTEKNMGVSVVIDLVAKQSCKKDFKQRIDHRTIQSIILRNVKYTLGKSCKEELPLDDRQDIKWDLKKLAVGNWLSEQVYYKLNRTEKDCSGRFSCKPYHKGEGPNYVIPPKQMSMMFNANLFNQTQKVTRTKLIELLLNAKETVLTVNFIKKIDSEKIEDVLKAAEKPAQLKEKAMAKKILNLGEPRTISGFLLDPSTNLGRCDVIDLAEAWGTNMRQVDLRTVQWIIIKNVKYEVK